MFCDDNRPADEPGRRPAFQRLPFPPERRLVLDTLRLGRNKPMMHAMFEVDVTRARALIRESRETTGAPVSFTAFVLACIGRAVSANPEVQAMRDRLGRIVIFNGVDATVMVEVEVEGRKFALAHVSRGIDSRTAQEISAEIRSIQESGIQSVPSRLQSVSRIFLRLPAFIRQTAYRFLLASPEFSRRHTGTLLVTSVGMFGTGAGWGFSAPGIHNLSILIGGIATRPSPTPGDALSEMLCLTVSANHETVDGAPVARFVSRLSREIESAEVLGGPVIPA